MIVEHAGHRASTASDSSMSAWSCPSGVEVAIQHTVEFLAEELAVVDKAIGRQLIAPERLEAVVNADRLQETLKLTVVKKNLFRA